MTTGVAQFPYPSSTAVPDIPADILLLTQRLALMNGAGIGYAADATALAATITNGDAFTGWTVYHAAADCLVQYNGSAFKLRGRKTFASAAAQTTWNASYSGLLETGSMSIRSDSGIEDRWSGSVWQPWSSPWIDYSNTVTVANWTPGTGTGAAKAFSYRYVNGRIRVKWYLGYGTTGASVSGGFVTFTLPFAAPTPPHTDFNYAGVAEIWDNSPAVLRVNCGVVSNGTSTTVVKIYTTTLAGNGYDFVAPAVPITWAVSDAVHGEFEYDPA